MTPSRFAWALAGIVLLAAVIRIPGLGRDGLWTDEATTVVLCERPLAGLLAALRADIQAPVYYLLEKAAIERLGTGEAAARALSVVAGLLGVLACGLAGRSLLGPFAGIAAASLLAVSPMHVTYSREARAYALLMVLVLLAFWAVDRLRREPSLSRAIVAGLVLALLPLTHGLGAVHGAGVAIAAALPAPGERAAFRRALPMLSVAAAISVAASLPWMSSAAGQGAKLGVAYAWAQRAWDASFPLQVPLSLLALVPGVSAPMRSLWLGPSWLDALAAAAAVVVVGLALALRRRLPEPSVPARLSAALLLSLGLVFTLSWLVAPLHVVGRAEAPLAPLMALLVASGLSVLPRPWPALGLAAFLALAAVPLNRALPETWKSEERTAARWVAVRANARDVVVALGSYRFAMEYYLPREMPGVRLVSFPEDRERHPSWVDWSKLGEAEAAREAEAFAARMAAEVAARPGAELVLLAVPEPTTPALMKALERRFRPHMTWESNLPGVTAWHYRLR